MKKLAFLIIAIAALVAPQYASAQRDDIIYPTEQNLGTRHTNLSKNNTGFFFAVEASGGVTVTGATVPMVELDVVGGYRFNEFVRLGIGLGPRYYINGDRIRAAKKEQWTMPLYLNIRGNFIPGDYRNVIPYYSVDAGYTIGDDFMIRPSVGVRFGSNRSAFLLGIAYLGQNMKTGIINPDTNKETKYFGSFLCLKLGYEF